METDPFKKYQKEVEPDKYYRSYAWKTAIGLQETDGLRPSRYLLASAQENIGSNKNRFADFLRTYLASASKIEVGTAQVVKYRSNLGCPGLSSPYR